MQEKARNRRGGAARPARSRAAERLEVDARTVHLLLHKKRLPALRVGQVVRLAESDVEAFALAVGAVPAVITEET